MALINGLVDVGILSLMALALGVYIFVVRPESRKTTHVIGYGLFFGAVAVALIAASLSPNYGHAYLSIAAPLILAGVLGRALSAAVAAAIALLPLFFISGQMASAVFIEVVAACFVACMAHWILSLNRDREIAFQDLLWVAAAALLVSLPAWFYAQAGAEENFSLADTWWSPLVGNVLGTLLLGGAYILSRRLRRRLDRADVMASQVLSTLHASNAGVWRYNTKTEQLSLDETGAKMIGAGIKPVRLSVPAFVDMLYDEDSHAILDALQHALGNHEAISLRAKAVCTNGRLANIEIVARAQEERQSLPWIVGILRDLTDEIEESTQNRLHTMALDKAASGIMLCRADGDKPILFVNEAFSRITGYSQSEVVGRNSRFLNEAEPDQPGVRTLREGLASGEPCSAIVRNYKKDGSAFWNHVTISPIYNDAGVLTHFVGVQANINLNAEVEAVSSRHKQRLEAILSSAPDAIVTVDKDLLITEFNNAAQRLFGWPRDRIVGRALGVLIPPEFSERHEVLARGFLEGGNNASHLIADWRSVQGLRVDGTTFPALITLIRFEVDGEPAVTAIARDMTSVAEMNRELFEMSNKLTRQLTEVQEANAAKSRFLAGMSHELRTPLNAIIGFSEAMKNSYFGKLDNPKYEEYVKDINESALHLLSLINDVLDLTAIENDKVPLHMERLPLAQVVDEALTPVTALLETKSLNLKVDNNAADFVIFGDRRALHQCLLNMLSNAIKFTDRSGLITVRGGIDELGRGEISVTDTGIGIPQDRIDKLAVPFEQVGDPMRAETKGTGLGLSITKSLVERMGGRFKLESVLGQGTTVRISFPRADGLSVFREPFDTRGGVEETAND